VAPEHKLRLVQAIQSQGQVVAMTGDGVNDAPALKQANIGVAMGITGTSVSKEAAELVLTDDNFATIRAAVEEGRRVYDNLLKSLAFVLPTNLGEALIILLAVLFFPMVGNEVLMPILPVQILWINLVATVALAIPLAFEAKEVDVMKRKPRNMQEPLFNRFVLWRTVMVAILMAAGAIVLFFIEYQDMLNKGTEETMALKVAQTMAVTTVIFFQIFYLFNCRSLKNSVFSVGFFSNKSVFVGIFSLLVLHAAFVYVPAFNSLFSSAPLTATEWIKAIAMGAIVLPVVAIEKAIRGKEKQTTV
jgi:magnesium-transporting ATPase (P-type)